MVVRAYNGENNNSRRGKRVSAKRTHLSTSLYQLMYCGKRSVGENIDCSSHCQIKNVSEQKPFVFGFVPFCLMTFFGPV
jgi:hypothetical protein